MMIRPTQNVRKPKKETNYAKGMKHSPEHRKKISERNKGNQYAKGKISVEQGQTAFA